MPMFWNFFGMPRGRKPRRPRFAGLLSAWTIRPQYAEVRAKPVLREYWDMCIIIALPHRLAKSESELTGTVLVYGLREVSTFLAARARGIYANTEFD